MTRWTGAFIAQQAVMLALWYGAIRYMIRPMIRELREEWKR